MTWQEREAGDVRVGLEQAARGETTPWPVIRARYEKPTIMSWFRYLYAETPVFTILLFFAVLAILALGMIQEPGLLDSCNEFRPRDLGACE